MIIPVSPIPVRIALETQTFSNNTYVTHDIDVTALIENVNSAQYELQLCYGTTSLYRSSVYHVSKYANSITFYFMVGQEMVSATLSASNNRCVFNKVSIGLDQNEVMNLIYASSEDVNDGYLESHGLASNTYTVGYSSERLCVEFLDEGTASFLFSVWAVGDTTGNAEQVFCTKVPSKNFLAKSTPSLFTVTQDSENTNLYYIACKTSGYTTTLNVTKIIDTSYDQVSIYMENGGS